MFIFCKPRSVFSSRLVSFCIVSFRFHSLSVRFTIQVLCTPAFPLALKIKKSPPDFSFGKSGSTNAKHRRETHNDKNIFVRTNQFFYASDAQKSLIKKSLKMRWDRMEFFILGINFIHSRSDRSIFFKFPATQKIFSFKNYCSSKNFFTPEKFHVFFGNIFVFFLIFFLRTVCVWTFDFFSARATRQNGSDGRTTGTTTEFSRKHIQSQKSTEINTQRDCKTEQNQPPHLANQPVTQNFVRTLTTDSVFGYRTEKLKNAFYEIDLPAPEFGSETVLWTFSRRAANAFCAMPVWQGQGFTSGNINGNAQEALRRTWNRTEKRHCLWELESGDEILPAEAAAIALKSYTPRTWGCAWLPLGLQLGRIQVALEPCLGCVWAVIGPWLGQWFALGMRLSCAWSAFGSRSDRVWVAFGNIRVVFR